MVAAPAARWQAAQELVEVSHQPGTFEKTGARLGRLKTQLVYRVNLSLEISE
jgi:hypothetical protein